MAKDRNESIHEEEEEEEEDRREQSKRDRHRISKRKKDESSSDGGSSNSEDDKKNKKKKKRRSRSYRRGRRDSSVSEEGSPSYDSYTDSGSEVSDSGEESESGSESEGELRRRKRKERKRREREHEKERKKRKEREKEKKRKRDKEQKRRKKADKDKTKKNKGKVLGKTGAVTNSWGKYGVIRETDMWNKRPEFTAWLAEVKKVNLESLPNWEEKQMFKEFMEDHNTATFPSKKYYGLDAYHKHKMEKEVKKGYKKVVVTERTVFNDEEQRRQELLRARERQKEVQVAALKLNMQSGMAQAMKEQARLREEMVYQYRLGNHEAAAAIQKRLDPDVAM